jgi:hypothetical protein
MENEILSKENQSEVKSGTSAFLFLVCKIKKKWLLFLFVGLIFGLLGIFYASKQEPTYESRLTFALDEGEESGLSGALGLAAQFGINIGGSKSVFNNDNIVEIMLSRRVLESVLLSVDTFKTPATFPMESNTGTAEQLKKKLGRIKCSCPLMAIGTPSSNAVPIAFVPRCLSAHEAPGFNKTRSAFDINSASPIE